MLGWLALVLCFDTLNWWWSDERCVCTVHLINAVSFWEMKEERITAWKSIFTIRIRKKCADWWNRRENGEKWKPAVKRFPRTNNWYHFGPLLTIVFSFTSCTLVRCAVGNCRDILAASWKHKMYHSNNNVDLC